MSVLVDTSVWVAYFRNNNNLWELDFLIDENLVVTNDLILSELVPFLKIRNQRKLIVLLREVAKIELLINWEEIIQYQYQCLKNGINGIGIPDLIIAQNAKCHQCSIFSLDNHFRHIRDILNIPLFDE